MRKFIYTKFNRNDGEVFKVGEKVQFIKLGKTITGTITGVAEDGYIKIDDHTIFVTRLKHASHEVSSTIPEAKNTFKSSADKDAEIARLSRELDECNNTIQSLPAIVKNAPEGIQPLLPEVQTEEFRTELHKAANMIVKAAQSGDMKEVEELEKFTSKVVKDIKTVAPSKTVSITNSCRVQLATIGGRDTIRIYFTEKPDKSLIEQIGKNNFRSYKEVIAGNPQWYWGAYFTEKRMTFAKGLCKEVESDKTSESPKVKVESVKKAQVTKSTNIPKEPTPESNERNMESSKILSDTNAMFKALLESKGVKI